MPLLSIDSTISAIGVVMLFLAGTAYASESSEALQLGNDAFNRGDLITAMAHYRKAADEGVAEGQVRLAWIMDQAEENEQAVFWYKKAAVQGDPDGQAGLAQMYAKGEGVSKDPAKALQLLEKAAEGGHKAAMSILASAYEKGELGVRPDAERSARWQAMLDDANESGDKD